MQKTRVAVEIINCSTVAATLILLISINGALNSAGGEGGGKKREEKKKGGEGGKKKRKEKKRKNRTARKLHGITYKIVRNCFHYGDIVRGYLFLRNDALVSLRLELMN